MIDFIVDSFKQGGWMLLPIFLASVWAWILVVRIVIRLWGLSLWKGTVNRLIRNPESIREWALKYRSRSAADTVAGGIAIRLCELPEDASREDHESAVEEVLRWKQPLLEKEISMVGGIAAMAPLLGLLGTVTGMITTFDVISAFGTSNPSLMADSISEALVTTQDGLVVALPLMVIHMVLLNFQQRIEDKANEMANAYIVHRFGSNRRLVA
jgi:biopolymer transport protein ExbB